MSDEIMTIRVNVRLLVAQENVRRAQNGEPELTQAQIAKDAGIAPSVLSTVMSGKVQRLDFGTLDRLCRYFQAQPGELLTWIPEDPLGDHTREQHERERRARSGEGEAQP